MKSKLLNLKFNENFKFQISNSKGFTLVELLLVIIIIGILATFIMTNIQSSMARSRDAKRKNDLKQIQNALELYRQDNGHYPRTSDTSCWPAGEQWLNSTRTAPWIPCLTSVYIKTMPIDPKNTGCTSSDPASENPADDPGGTSCFEYAYLPANIYCTSATKTIDGYILVTRLEQYSGSDLSQQLYYYDDGTSCGTWHSPAVNGIYTLSNP